MKRHVNYAAVGIFVLVLGTFWVLLSIWLIFGDVRHTYTEYHVYMTESVSGLSRDAAVRYRGVNVGKVSDIALPAGNPELVRLVLQIREGTPVKTDTTATLSAYGLTGLYFVELSGGTREAPLLEPSPGETVPIIQYKPSLLVRVEEVFYTLSDQLDRLAGSLNLMVTEDNAERVEGILGNIERFSGALAESGDSFSRGVEDAAGTFGHLRDVSGRVAARGDELERALKELPELVEGMNGVIDELHSLTANVNAAASATLGTTVAELTVLMGDMQTTLARLNELMRQLEEQPNMLISGRRERKPGPGE